ncbi:ABC transporter ATP-binding protein [Thioalkalivibrio sp. HK1]|uniref:ABC transporter ATP-binding protein n=1 Tax=Thioalkalivibrio sp. HK1 TaxID=1469245 RepID=UPI0004711E5E|nr:ABC transporter ATP-binding protein [Thioalkalivibrio sp. HK1]
MNDRNSESPIIEIRGATRHFGGAWPAVDNIDLDIAEGEFFALLGPSGCGKTTLLRMIAGFENPNEGTIRIDGVDVAGLAPNRRPVNMVFQSYAVFPFMSVFDNIAYGLKVSKVPVSQRRKRVEEALALVRLDGLGQRMPDQISGGQRQRVALARALVKRPRVLLLDEPLSALDAKLRETMQMELVSLQKKVGITFVLVTHDQDEALSMADRIAIMDRGRVRQIADPTTIYESPTSRFVAEFIGKVNLFDAVVKEVLDAEDRIVFEVEGLGELRLPRSRTAGSPMPAASTALAIRPEKIRLSAERPADPIAFEARLEGFAYHGSQSHLHLITEGGGRLSVTSVNSKRKPCESERGKRCFISWDFDDTLILNE